MSRTITHRDGLWIGTKEYMRWLPAPARGVDSTSGGYHEDAVGKNGGGYVSHSFGRHQRKQYTWPRSTPREVANFVQGMRDGLYGRGVIHFTDPTCYRTNIMAPHWASPGLTLGFEAPPLVFREQPETFEFGMSDRANTPMRGATYRNLPENLTPADGFFIAIPPGMTLLFGSRYEATGGGRVYLQGLTRNFGINPSLRTSVDPGIDPVNPFRHLTTTAIPSTLAAGVYVWVGRELGSNKATSSVSILDMMAKLVPTGIEPDWDLQFTDDPWYGGEGNTGMAFVGQPTIQYDGKDNTQVSATFMETGAWELASRL